MFKSDKYKKLLNQNENLIKEVERLKLETERLKNLQPVKDDE